MSEKLWDVTQNDENCYTILMKSRVYIMVWDIVLKRHVIFCQKTGNNGTLYQQYLKKQNGPLLRCVITLHSTTGCIQIQGKGARLFMEMQFPTIEYEVHFGLVYAGYTKDGKV